MKSNLIYTLAFGQHLFKVMAQFCTLSIVEWTNFGGDIIVLTDSDVLTSDLNLMTNRVQIINIFDKFPELKNKIKDRFNIFCMKPLISQIINIKDYGYILYVDGDVLINYKNLNELMGFWASCGQIQISGNGRWNVDRNVCNTGSDVLTPEEKIKHSNFGVCAGVVGFPGNELGESFCNDWWEYNKVKDFSLDDQGNLTALIIRKYWNKFKYIDFINTNKWKCQNITHYHTKKKDGFWESAKYLLKKYEIKENRHLGVWTMSKPLEGIKNTWEFTNTMVFVDDPNITGQLQHTIFGTYIWWILFNGFEKIKFTSDNLLYGDSYQGGESCFTLSKIIN